VKYDLLTYSLFSKKDLLIQCLLYSAQGDDFSLGKEYGTYDLKSKANNSLLTKAIHLKCSYVNIRHAWYIQINYYMLINLHLKRLPLLLGASRRLLSLTTWERNRQDRDTHSQFLLLWSKKISFSPGFGLMHIVLIALHTLFLLKGTKSKAGCVEAGFNAVLFLADFLFWDEWY
jgi:hypothetical protein